MRKLLVFLPPNHFPSLGEGYSRNRRIEFNPRTFHPRRKTLLLPFSLRSLDPTERNKINNAVGYQGRMKEKVQLY
jgi:hypothetical protein